jgi:hypothetical protein
MWLRLGSQRTLTKFSWEVSWKIGIVTSYQVRVHWLTMLLRALKLHVLLQVVIDDDDNADHIGDSKNNSCDVR